MIDRQFMLGVGLLLLSATALAQSQAGPPTEPQLVIETGMHVGAIRGMSTDRERRTLVTGADDKTIRVWDIATGELQRVLRPPIAGGQEGSITAVAISPDGRRIAAAGYTGVTWDQTVSIYVFDRQSGRMVQRFGQLHALVFKLLFSPDGKRLVATLGEGKGAALFDATTGALIGRDENYFGADSYAADVAPDGRILTAADDASLRLYDSQLKIVVEGVAPGGQHAQGVRFSPDGKLVAVGYADAKRVDVLNASDLKPAYQPDVTGVRGPLEVVAWSNDGRFLYAGGHAGDGVSQVIRRWSNGGKGSSRDLSGFARETVEELLPMPNGRMLFATADPMWGVLGADGAVQQSRAAETAHFWTQGAGFQVDGSGSRVRFRWQSLFRDDALFSIPDRSLVPDAPWDERLRPSRQFVPGVDLTGWTNTPTLALNGTRVALADLSLQRQTYVTRAKAAAVSADGSFFVVGLQGELRAFRTNNPNEAAWVTKTPGTTGALAIADDAHLVVAGYGDGTIRWYRQSDGQELLALYPNPDRRRWIAFTPSGYYDASVGAESLIGWHLNRGASAAGDFFPLARFRTRYYRPDVIARVLAAGDEARALAEANTAAGRSDDGVAFRRLLPPIVAVLSPDDGARSPGTTALLSLSVRSPSGEPVRNVRVLVDGRLVAEGADLLQPGPAVEGVPSEESKRVQVPMPDRSCTVSVIAETAFAASEPASVRLVSGKGKAPAKPKLHLLAIGVSSYAHADLALDFPAKDAADLVAAFKAQEGRTYSAVDATVLTDGAASRSAIQQSLDALVHATGPNDVAVIFIAGHGINEEKTGRYFYLPYDADPDAPEKTMVAGELIQKALGSIRGKVILFLDSCHSGNVVGSKPKGQDVTGIVNDLSSAEAGVVVFAASSGAQQSQEMPAWGNGAFTKAVVEALRGVGDDHPVGEITVGALDLYVSERVKALTNGAQTPTTARPSTLPDFTVAVVQ